MLAPTEQLKKEIIALATLVEHFFINDINENQIPIIRDEDLHRIHKNTIRILMTKRSFEQKQLRFLTTAMKTASNLFKVYQLTNRSYASKLTSQVFSLEINDLKKELGKKLQQSIDAFSYEYKELILKVNSNKSSFQRSLQYVEQKILEEIEQSPKLIRDGHSALKQISLLQYIDDELNEMIDNILHGLGFTQVASEEKVEKVNMLDYIKSNGFINEMRGNP